MLFTYQNIMIVIGEYKGYVTLKIGQIAARTIPGILYREALFPLPQIITTSLKIGFCSVCNSPTLFIKSVKYKCDPSCPWGAIGCGFDALIILLKGKIFSQWREKDEERNIFHLLLNCFCFRSGRTWSQYNSIICYKEWIRWKPWIESITWKNSFRNGASDGLGWCK